MTDDLPPAAPPSPHPPAQPFTMRDGTHVLIRPIRPDDVPAMVRFHHSLSDESVRMRYFSQLKLGQRVARDRLARVCHAGPCELVLVVTHREPASPPTASEEPEEIVAVGRLSKVPEHDCAEFAIVISDPWQRRGLGHELLGRLVRIARDEGIGRVVADILPDNVEMQAVCRDLGFTLRRGEGDAVRSEIILTR